MFEKAKVFADEHIQSLKDRLKILHDTEDEYLKRILASSVIAVATLVGASELSESLVELACERAMFIYNDALDEFKSLYEDEIEHLYLMNLIVAKEADSDDEREEH